jgi:hypothetical protein
MYGKWLLTGKCPLTPAENIGRPSEALLNNMNGTEDDVVWEESHY